MYHGILFYDYLDRPSLRFFGGGSAPKISPPPKPEKQQEVRRIVENAGEARRDEQRRIPPGREATMFAGIEKQLKAKLG